MKLIYIIGIIFIAALITSAVIVYKANGGGEKFIQTCHYGKDFSPDPLCTPGDSGVIDLKILCAPTKYDSTIPKSLTREVFAKYGITDTTNYRIDNLVPLELGGSNAITNLWPQPINPTPGFNEKNKAEVKLHELVCANKMPLKSAQYMISHNWKINSGLYNVIGGK